jgi:hypothetical protein
MSYSDPDRRTYSFGIHDFGAGSESLSITGPKGKTGTLVAIHAAATETFNAVTTAANIQVGTAADPDAYALFNLGTLADTDSASTDDGTTDTDAIISASIPADTQVEVTFTAPTGGTPAGMAAVTVIIDWAW